MLRDYQLSIISRLHDAWQTHRSVMLQMPTGTGKTHVMAAVIQEFLASSYTHDAGAEPESASESVTPSVLVVSHRRELLGQIRSTLAAFGLADGRIMVESIQKLSRHVGEMSASFQLIIVDEAHHALARTYRRLWDRWNGARFLGLTATPCRMSGDGFTDLFETLVQSHAIQEFIDAGWLSDFEYVAAAPDCERMRKVWSLKGRGSDGDFIAGETVTVMDTEDSVEHTVRTYMEHARGRKGIVYAIDRNHAAHIAQRYGEHGVRTCVVDAGTPAGERERLVAGYREGRIDVMVNVDVFSEGFDCPEVGFIQLARPTLSLSRYMQQVGRGMRTADGKSHVVVIDMAGLCHRFGLPTEERNWNDMFMGRRTAGGDDGLARPVMVEWEGKECMDGCERPEMVRMRKVGEGRRRGTELFLMGGRYGVMRDGKITCPARFESVRRLGGKYFALGTYPYGTHRGKTTVIDADGHDMKAELYGRVTAEGDIFRAVSTDGSYRYWDAVGGRYYGERPEVVMIGGMEAVKTGGRYVTRRMVGNGFRDREFSREEVLHNGALTIIGDMLIVRKDMGHPYRICGYTADSILVMNRKSLGYIQILYNGNIGQPFDRIPNFATKYPNIHGLKLQRCKESGERT